MAALKVGLSMLGPCLFGYIVGPPLYWHFMEAVSHSSDGCLPFLCDCSFRHLLTIPEGGWQSSNLARLYDLWTEQCFLCRSVFGFSIVEVTSNPAHKKSQKGAGVGTPGAHSDG